MNAKNVKNAKNELSRAQMIAACAGEDKDAALFLTLFVERAHWLDDLADLPGSVMPEEIAGKEMAWLVVLSQNPFFLTHKERLTPLMLLALNGWVDSETMPPGDQRDVVKGLYHEVGYAVALITGGWKRLRSVTSAMRHYDIESGVATSAGRVPVTFDVDRCAMDVPPKGGL